MPANRTLLSPAPCIYLECAALGCIVLPMLTFPPFSPIHSFIHPEPIDLRISSQETDHHRSMASPPAKRAHSDGAAATITTELTGQDYGLINTLLHSFLHAIDENSPDTFASLFADDDGATGLTVVKFGVVKKGGYHI